MSPRAAGGTIGRRGRKPSPPGRVRIGISGWTYPGWRKRFYPEGLAHRRELEYASSMLESIEINGSLISFSFPNARKSSQPWMIPWIVPSIHSLCLQ